MELLAALVAGGAMFLFLAYMVRERAMRPQEARLKYLSASEQVNVTASSDGAALLRRPGSSFVARALSGSEYAKRWEFDLERADLKLKPSEYFLMRLALALVTVALFTLFGRNGIAFIISLPLAFIAYMAPAYWVRIRTQRRLAAINKQLVETTTMIVNSLRAGFAFSQGIDAAARQVGPPMSVELGRLLLDINLGMNTEDALQAMNVRVGSDDLDMIITAILIQRQSGGNLAEVLENVTETIRDRERIKGEIKTMTSQQRMSGWVLSLWPPLLGGVLALFNIKIMALFFTMTLGNILLAIWLGLWVIGVFAIQRILDIDI